MLPFAMFGLAVLVILAMAFFGSRAAKARRAELAAWAQGTDYVYAPDKVRVDFPFEATRRGRNRYLRDLFTGEFSEAVPGLGSARVRLFLYHYERETGHGEERSNSHYHLTCALLEPNLRLGRVSIESEGLFDRMAQSLGFEDIDFDDPEFSKRFKVTAEEPRDAHELIGPELMELLLSEPGWRLETHDRLLLLWREGRPGADDFSAADAFARKVLASLPRLLVNLERERRGLAPEIRAGAASDERSGG